MKKSIAVLLVITFLSACSQQAQNQQKLITQSWILDIKTMKDQHKASNSDEEEEDKLGKFLGNVALAFVGFLAQEIKFDFKPNGYIKAKAPLFDIEKEQLGRWRIEGNELLLKFEYEEDDGSTKTLKLKFEIININSKQLVLKAEDAEDNLYLKVKTED